MNARAGVRARARQPRGAPSGHGGEFAEDPRPDAPDPRLVAPGESAESNRPLLANYEHVGFHRNTVPNGDGTSRPGGTCGNCGQAVANCVTVRHIRTGHTMTVGLDCAERVGLDRHQVRELMH
jgi:hypothetical protein